MNKGIRIGIIVLTLIAVVACIVGVLVGITALTEKTLLPDDWLFYGYRPWAEVPLFLFVFAPLFIVFILLMDRIKINPTPNDDIVYGIKRFLSQGGVFRFILPLVWIFVIYICFTSITVVTPDKIIYHTPLHPSGREYAYTDVEKVETGFGQRKIALYEYKKEGSFYYTITIDGKEIVFSQPTVNSDIERYNDTYLEFEEFDEALMSKGIKKESSREGYEDCDYEKRYVDRFLRIIDRK